MQLVNTKEWLSSIDSGPRANFNMPVSFHKHILSEKSTLMIGLGLYKFGCQNVPVSSRPLYLRYLRFKLYFRGTRHDVMRPRHTPNTPFYVIETRLLGPSSEVQVFWYVKGIVLWQRRPHHERFRRIRRAWKLRAWAENVWLAWVEIFRKGFLAVRYGCNCSNRIMIAWRPAIRGETGPTWSWADTSIGQAWEVLWRTSLNLATGANA